MLCNPVVWKVTLLLRYLKLQRITAVQFVYCFRKKIFLSWCFMLLKVTTTCSVNFHPVTFMWNSQNPSFLILFGCPSHSSSFDYSFFFFFPLFSVWGRVSPVLGGSGQARQVWGVLQTHPAYPPHRQHGSDDWLRRRSRRPAPDQQRRQLRQGGVNRSPAPQDLHTETR